MTNKYMFFKEQKFEGFDLDGFEKNDISILKTDIHIYEFSCKQANDEDTAKKLDELTQRLEENYKDQFITVCSESSQFFCSKLYPLIVNFETKLRYALYISRSLFENGNVNKDSFLIDDANKKNQKKRVEEAEFGDFYKFVFSPENFYTTLKTLINSEQMTKSEYIEKIKSLDDSTMWQNWVGDDYNFIQENFIAIKDFRNDVMHNHLIDFERYEKAKKIIKKANDTLDRAINDKLIVNDSKYLNGVNIFETLSGAYKAVDTLSAAVESMVKIYSEHSLASSLATAAKTDSLFSNLSAIAEVAKDVTPVYPDLSDMIATVTPSAMYSSLNDIVTEAKANTAFSNLSDLAATARASVPSDLKAMTAAANLAKEYSDSGSKSASSMMAKELEKNNSSITQQNDDENSKNPSDMEDKPND